MFDESPKKIWRNPRITLWRNLHRNHTDFFLIHTKILQFFFIEILEAISRYILWRTLEFFRGILRGVSRGITEKFIRRKYAWFPKRIWVNIWEYFLWNHWKKLLKKICRVAKTSGRILEKHFLEALWKRNAWIIFVEIEGLYDFSEKKYEELLEKYFEEPLDSFTESLKELPLESLKDFPVELL